MQWNYKSFDDHFLLLVEISTYLFLRVLIFHVDKVKKKLDGNAFERIKHILCNDFSNDTLKIISSFLATK